jgi:uncharacterized protein YrrD
MTDPRRELGPPIAYTVLTKGTPVYDRRGERVGVVDRVLGDPNIDIFDGLLVRAHPLGRRVFADAAHVAELHERGVLLSVDRDVLLPGAA